MKKSWNTPPASNEISPAEVHSTKAADDKLLKQHVLIACHSEADGDLCTAQAHMYVHRLNKLQTGSAPVSQTPLLKHIILWSTTSCSMDSPAHPCL